MQLIQQLEALGQTGSLKQFESVLEMLKKHQVNSAFLRQVNLTSSELICFVEPDDDDEEDSK
jgi:hypothetical protein